MNSIYASKIYKHSSRKSKIIAAMNNPINVELMQQVAEYLDDEYKPDMNEPVEDLDTSAKDISEANTDEDTDKVDDSTDTDVNIHIDSKNDKSSNTDTLPNASPMLDDTVDPDDISLKEEDEPIDSSTDIESKFLNTDDIILLLNSVDLTAGVDRISDRDGEVWIYYNGNTNLNNIMTAVIDSLNNNGYTNLTFNRLVRTENAIVFESYLGD